MQLSPELALELQELQLAPQLAMELEQRDQWSLKLEGFCVGGYCPCCCFGHPLQLSPQLELELEEVRDESLLDMPVRHHLLRSTV